MLACNGFQRYKPGMPTAKSSRKLKITLRELSPEEIHGIFPLIQVLNPALTKATFTARLKKMAPLGYRAVAAFEGERMVGLSGFWMWTRFWCGTHLDIDNFVVHPDYRNAKVGEKLVAWLEKLAIKEKADLMVLDVYAENHRAQRFYFRSGFVGTGKHFTKIPGSRVPYGT